MKKRLVLIAGILLVTLFWTEVQFAASPTDSLQVQFIENVNPIKLQSDISFNSCEEHLFDGIFAPKPLSFLAPLELPQDDWTDCVGITDVKRGDRCGSPTSLIMKVENTCSQAIDAKFCIERENGTWECGVYSNLRPGASTTWYTCKSTGDIKYYGRKAGSSVRFPDPNNP